jgi:hypothetical protein
LGVGPQDVWRRRLYRPGAHPGCAGPRIRRQARGIRVGLRVRLGRGARWGVTGGPHLSAAVSGGRGTWAALGRNAGQALKLRGVA